MLGLASFFGVTVLKEKLQVDDALDVTVVHGLTGIIGSFAIGIAVRVLRMSFFLQSLTFLSCRPRENTTLTV